MRKGAQGPARRYARALLEVAAAQKLDLAALATELAQAASVLQGSEELQRALTHPALPVERRKKVAEAVFEGASPLLARLLGLLLERDRLELLADVSRLFTLLWNEERGVLTAEAITAVALGPEQKGALGKALANATGKKVELSARVDPSLLGGVLVRMGGRTYDGSVRARLQALRDTLSGRPAGA
jgi:F-type H+-transporting ATPase subunit delta